MADLTDLKRTTAEKAAEWGGDEKYAATTPDYGYGLQVTLGGPELEKLGRPAMRAGQEVTFTARARVSQTSSEEINGKVRTSAQLTIEAMDIPNVDVRSDAAVMYGADSDGDQN